VRFGGEALNQRVTQTLVPYEGSDQLAAQLSSSRQTKANRAGPVPTEDPIDVSPVGLQSSVFSDSGWRLVKFLHHEFAGSWTVSQLI
jgi:hypothetical protein